MLLINLSGTHFSDMNVKSGTNRTETSCYFSEEDWKNNLDKVVVQQIHFN